MTDSLDRLKTALADRYAIEREIGAGGMATVYLAEDLKHHRQVAVKVLRPALAALLGSERFLKEIEVTANLDAERVYRRAIALNPGYAYVHHSFGWFLSYLGRHDEAVVELERARELDPLSAIINADLGGVYFNARRYDEAATWNQRALEFEPGFLRGVQFQVQLHVIHGNPEDGLAGGRRPLDWWSSRLGEAHVLAALGRRAEAESIVRAEIATVGGQDSVGVFQTAFIAMVYIALGDNDVALNWLEQAVDDGLSAGPISLKVWPFFDPLRSDPRFAALLQQMGFPE